VHHFGKFASEKDAMEWITAHAWLAEAPNADPPQVVSRRVRARGAAGLKPVTNLENSKLRAKDSQRRSRSKKSCFAFGSV
jgi:hypothetical protein